jgi:NAD(P)-dependent dehydrogenase (short-subunit alcohol dehydrogenase family)
MTDRKLRLEGKVAIATGGGSLAGGIGIGKATAILFGREGAKVLVVDLHPERAEETVQIITSEGGEASAFTADVTKAMECQAMVAAAVERYGRLDILHNNVGRNTWNRGIETVEEDWDIMMESCLKSMMLTSKFAIPQMIAGGGGSIINISSIAALHGTSHNVYAAAKGGIIALTRAMAFSYAGNHVRVNCIAPGSIWSPRHSSRESEELREKRRLRVPLQTEGTGWDVGWAAVYLASEEARWVTGVVIPVDGGDLLTSTKI